MWDTSPVIAEPASSPVLPVMDRDGHGDCVVVGITGPSRCHKAHVAKELVQRLVDSGNKAVMVSQKDFWYRSCQVVVGGRLRTTDDEPECINHEKFRQTIEDHMKCHD